MGKRVAPAGRLYLDALGDPGRSPGSLPTYAVCTIWVPVTEDVLEEMVAETRRRLGLRAGYEFHARQLQTRDWAAEMPMRFFESLLDQGLNLECWCAEVQKSRSRLPLQIAGKSLTQELVAQTLLRMPRERVAGQTLIIDEEAKGKAPKVIQELRSAVRRALEAEGRDYNLGKVSARAAHQKAGLQLADFLVAALVEPWPSCAKVLGAWTVHHWRT